MTSSEDRVAPARVLAVAGELLEDREVADPVEDRLNHLQVAQQLADLATAAPNPSNIALYGAWGSGKTGIGNLVKVQLESRPTVGFARFDAFKYAENPLRRNFVSAVATQLGITDGEFHHELYTGKTTTDFDVPVWRLFKLVGLFAFFAVGISVALLAIGAGVAALQTGPFSSDFRSLGGDLVQAGLAPAALLAALVALAGKSLVVERRTEKADSDEQFEKVFERLVKRARKERVIVFVDELDRCAPADVVATLDAIRTFLGVKGCVFVVAADRQVLEEALSSDVPQATPTDALNPYYSVGSAYLDKVFQYQVVVPPLLQHSVTRFAVDLVRDRPGVWQELGHGLDLTVSILVPSHVRSPRRVKNLLNAFVLAYRLAEARYAAGLLSFDARSSAEAIARLVCFRVEFPLFARYLVVDARLPEYVLHLQDDDADDVWEEFPYATDDVREAAEAFAALEEPVATLLSDASEDDETDADSASSRRARNVQRKHGQQLLDYLSRTRSVRGPSRDLVYLRSTGSVVGLDGDVAERIERSATDADSAGFLRLVRDMKPDEQQAALALLIEQSRSAAGIERRNVAALILAAAAQPQVDITPKADALADALAPAVDDFADLLDGPAVGGAWRIGVAASREPGATLRRHVLSHPSAVRDRVTALHILASPEAALEADPSRTAEILARHLTADHVQETVNTIVALPPGVVTRLLEVARSQLTSAVHDLLTESADSAPAPTTAASAEAGATSAQGTGDPAAVLAALGTALTKLDPGDRGPAQALAGTLLELDDQRVRTVVERNLTELGAIVAPPLVVAFLDACGRRRLDLWARWLRHVPASAMASGDTRDELQRLLDVYWRRATNATDRPGAGVIIEVGALLRMFVDAQPEDGRPALAGAALVALGSPVATEAEAAERRRLHAALGPIISAGLLSPGVVAQRETEHVAVTLREEVPLQEPDSVLVTYVWETALLAIEGWPHAGAEPEPPSAEAIAELVGAAGECEWLPEPSATALPLRLMAAAGGKALGPLPNASEIAAFRATHGTAASGAVAAWLSIVSPSLDGLTAVVSAVISDRATAEEIRALERTVAHLDGRSRVSLLAAAIGTADSPRPSADVLQVFVDHIPDIEVARVIASRYADCGNNPERREVLELWQLSSVSAEAARRHLVENVLIPLVRLNVDGGNSQAAGLGVEFLVRLASPIPQGTKKALGEAVIAATKGTTHEGRAVKALEQLGFKVSKAGLFRRRKSVDTGRDVD